MDTFIEQLKKENACLQEGIEMFERGDMDIGEVDGRGVKISLREETITRYKHTISGNSRIIERLEEKLKGADE